MQDFIDQANKNCVKLLDKGKCQFCGADFQHGIFDCMHHYNNGLELIDFNLAANNTYRFLSVDAHALQHPEIHGRWSNHFHLTRLNLMLEKKTNWDYQTSPLLSNYLNAYKTSRPNEFLISPKPLERGTITTKDFTKVTTAEASMDLIKKWAAEVYLAWKENHLIIAQISDRFLEKYGPGQTRHRKS